MDISDFKKSLTLYIRDILEIMENETYEVSSHNDWYNIHNMAVDIKKRLLAKKYKHRAIKKERRWIVNKSFKKR